jgi:hypothetical protein
LSLALPGGDLAPTAVGGDLSHLLGSCEGPPPFSYMFQGKTENQPEPWSPRPPSGWSQGPPLLTYLLKEDSPSTVAGDALPAFGLATGIAANSLAFPGQGGTPTSSATGVSSTIFWMVMGGTIFFPTLPGGDPASRTAGDALPASRPDTEVPSCSHISTGGVLVSACRWDHHGHHDCLTCLPGIPKLFC